MLAALVLAADLATKALMQRWLTAPGDSITLIPGFFHFTLGYNRGIAFGMLQHGGDLLVWLLPPLLLAILWHAILHRHGPLVDTLCLGAIFGGALGNYYERLRFGKVCDFLDVRFGSYDFPVFNLADSAISVGVAVMILFAFIRSRQEKGLQKSGAKSQASE